MQDSERWTFAIGDCVRLSRMCPMDFEGVGPMPGADGRVVGLPRSTDPRRCVAVRFEGYACNWLVPRVYLEQGREAGTALVRGTAPCLETGHAAAVVRRADRPRRRPSR